MSYLSKPVEGAEIGIGTCRAVKGGSNESPSHGYKDTTHASWNACSLESLFRACVARREDACVVEAEAPEIIVDLDLTKWALGRFSGVLSITKTKLCKVQTLKTC